MNPILDQPVSAGTARTAAHILRLNDKEFDQFVQAAGLTPTSHDWQRWLKQLFLLAGMLFLSVGIVSFFAYNWADLHRFSKFAILQAGLILALAMVWRRGLDSTVGQCALFFASVMVGVHLAVYGQTYQTGADPYGLFLGWAVLVLPWTVLGKNRALIVLQIFLANLALIFYWDQIILAGQADFMQSLLGSLFGPIAHIFVTKTQSSLPLVIVAMNGLGLALIEKFKTRFPVLRSRLLFETLALWLLIPLASSTVTNLVFGPSLLIDDRNSLAVCTVFVFIMTGGAYYFRYRRRNLMLTSVIVLSLIAAFSVWIVRASNLLRGQNFAGPAFLIGIFILGASMLGGLWLRNTYRTPAREISHD